MPLGLHYRHRLPAHQTAPHKQPQHPLPHCCLHALHTSRIHLRSVKRQPLPPRRNHTIQHPQVQMHVRVQSRANAMHKQPAARARCTARIAIPPTRFRQPAS